MDDRDRNDFIDALRRWQAAMILASIESAAALEPPASVVLADVTTNAVLIDGVGRTRQMNLPDRRPEWLVPIPQRLSSVMPTDEELVMPPRFPVARFVLSTVQDAKAVYRYAGRRD